MAPLVPEGAKLFPLYGTRQRSVNRFPGPAAAKCGLTVSGKLDTVPHASAGRGRGNT